MKVVSHVSFEAGTAQAHVKLPLKKLSFFFFGFPLSQAFSLQVLVKKPWRQSLFFSCLPPVRQQEHTAVLGQKHAPGPPAAVHSLHTLLKHADDSCMRIAHGLCTKGMPAFRNKSRDSSSRVRGALLCAFSLSRAAWSSRRAQDTSLAPSRRQTLMTNTAKTETNKADKMPDNRQHV